MHTATHGSWKRPIGVLGLVALLLYAPLAHASSWSPTFLVNTESFQTIDEGDSSTNIEIRFGDQLNEKILYDRTNLRFKFSRSVLVGGDLTATGSLSVKKVMSGSALRVDRNADIWGALGVSGATLLDGNLTIGDASTDAVTVNANAFTFANDTNFTLSGGENGLSFDTSTLSIDAAGNRVGIGTTAPETELEVIGTASGRILRAQDTLASSGGLVWEGTASGASIWVSKFDGAGLTDCDAAGSKVIWDTTSKKFSCGADAGSGAPEIVDHYVRASGDTMTGALAINVSGSATVTADSGLGLEVMGTASGRRLHAQDLLTASGTLAVDGAAAFNGGVTIGDASTDTVTVNSNAFTFANDTDFTLTGGENGLSFDGTTFSVDALNNRVGIGTAAPETALDVIGTISGSALTLSSGQATIRGVSYTFPTAGGLSGALLRTDSSGNLNWYKGAGKGSGSIVALVAAYPNAVYFASGSSTIGQLTSSGAQGGSDNFYRWTTSKSGVQDYWVATRVRVPDNFVGWESTKPIEFRYRTGTGTAVNNHLTVRMLDTAGAVVPLSGNSNLANATFATATITGPETAGTYTKGGYVTLLVKLASKTGWYAHAGNVNLNWETTSP